MIELGSNFIRLNKESIFHMKPTDIVTVSGDGEDTRIVVYSENGFTRLEVVTPTKVLSPHDIVTFYEQFAPSRLDLH